MTAFPYKKAHFIGVAGVGMSATAILLRDSGVSVTGSDEAIYPPISHVLAREGLDCRTPYAPNNIPDGAGVKRMLGVDNDRGEEQPSPWVKIPVRNRVRNISEIESACGRFGGKLVLATLYHDLGYSKQWNVTGFHPVEGVRRAGYCTTTLNTRFQCGEEP